MLNEIPDLPPGVIGFEVSGKLETEDYRDTLLPALQEAAEAGEVRVMIEIPKFDGFTPGALWQDVTMGVEHWRAWKRIALVTDIDWMTHASNWFGWMTPGQLKTFSLADRAAAIEWVSG